MSVREYIGARYVPLFADPIQWDSTLSYEPLTVVKNQGTSYVSKRSVPEGIDILNETYWLRWADYNAQLEEYIRQVQQYNARIQENADDITTINESLPINAFDNVNTVDARFDAIESDNWVTNARIADNAINTDEIANNAVTTDKIADGAVTTVKIANSAVTADKIANNAVTEDKIAKSNFVLFGDSWTDFTAGFENWYSANNFSKVLHCNLYNFGVGGAGFIGGSSLISAQITRAAGEMNSAEKNNTKYVCVVGGINDIANANPGVASDSVWNSAVTNILQEAASMFPNAKVVYAPDCCARERGAYKKAEMVRLALQYKNVHIPYINGPIIFAPNLPLFWTGHSDNEVFRSDNLHLNANGADAFGKQILSAFTGQNSEPIVGVSNIGDITFIYDCYGNGDISATHTFSSTSIVDLSTTANPITEWTDAFATYIASSRIWIGTSGTSGTTAWIRSAGSNRILAKAQEAGTYYF